MGGMSISILTIVLVVLAIISYAIWSARKSADPDLTGKHGWLFLAGVGLFPMLAMATLKLEVFSGTSVSAEGALEIWMRILTLTTWCMIGIMFVALYNYARNARAFAQWYVASWVCLLAVSVLQTTVVTAYIDSTYAEFAWPESILILVNAAIWSVYVLRSRRVANTMVN
jgi:hypothetical protein